MAASWPPQMGFRCLQVCVRNATAGEAQNEKHRDQESLIQYLSATLRASPGPVATATARRQHGGGIALRDTCLPMGNLAREALKSGNFGSCVWSVCLYLDRMGHCRT